ncbi:hypothetical protein TRVL_09503 [Trypanosoma vivax]|nr:hypothetical protein TRVL_09503 [Trypanosoma vivax]
MCGWGAPVFKDGGEVCVAGDAWEREPHCISQGEARAMSLALRSFAETMPKNLHIGTGNATAVNIMKKGNARSDVLVFESSLIEQDLQEQGVQASRDCIASPENPPEGIYRGNGLGNVGVAKGSAECELINTFQLLPLASH